MLVTLKQILKLGEAGGFAVGAFNCPDLAAMRAAIAAAEELEQPVILAHAQLHEDVLPLELAGPIMLQLADRARVPVCVHLDHGTSLDYLNRALKLGFTSIMFDGSGLSYEENCASTCVAVELAARTGASVEAEIGVIGANGADSDIYTDPVAAQDFVARTGIDALACAFGTVHGLYLREPKLDFERVKTLHATLPVPLVMHGGSGVSEDDYRRVIACGIRKINYFTYMSKAGGVAVQEKLAQVKVPYFHEMDQWAMEAMTRDVLAAIRVFSGK